ncbi:unnamed protein product [Rotaria socialis]|uniref:G-protein coupled receptors family 1 profile domain-containing protein n=1 Tax=Rotaria socialis TaxID=392032 RepID=A0A818B1C4_9BILA|nr:unnamed protein product [Rotaria socialis]CAF3441112.1 unnamed protein product [Rotaria socialis]CAF3490600.1 unnamed protein product [Rotaria socialis]CAF4239157.1 unnamed protein product [Rotaria socialis]CAF4456619.1 unnamed protein product [Rotaria socialis]
MGILCVLTLINVRQQSHQIRPSLSVGNDSPRRLDDKLIRMLFSQILTQLICILPYAVFNLAVFFIELNSTSFEFFDLICILLLYVSYAISFYIFTLLSRADRKKLVKLTLLRKSNQIKIPQN